MTTGTTDERLVQAAREAIGLPADYSDADVRTHAACVIQEAVRVQESARRTGERLGLPVGATFCVYDALRGAEEAHEAWKERERALLTTIRVLAAEVGGGT